MKESDPMSKPPIALATLDDPRWASVQARDPAADGAFLYAVLTTGVYCRPSCASRPAKPEHVRFYDTEAAARAAGFRPCKRCAPDLPPRAERQAALIAALCRHIEEAEEPPTLDNLAALAELSPAYTQRLFKATTGVTPRAYAAAHRAAKVREALVAGDPVTEALYAAGYSSSGRFYAESTARLGMTPSRFRAGGDAEAIRFALGECALGSILVAATAQGVCAILLGDEPEPLLRDLERRFPRADLLGADDAFEELVARVIALVEEPTQAAALPLDIRGTAFQQRVWAADLPGAGDRHRRPPRRPRRRPGLRRQRTRRCHPLSPRHPHQRRPRGLPLGRRAQARAAGPRARPEVNRGPGGRDPWTPEAHKTLDKVNNFYKNY
jgi:AraC family transcriptional regulator of adaptative response/methylated-DNA-[protein]-cysteine methyltransferase